MNLIDLEKRRAAEMQAKLDRHIAEAPVEDVKQEGIRIDPGIADRLRAMGYLR